MGDGKIGCQLCEKENRVEARRSITANEAIKKGTKITREMIGFKRPAKGINPKFVEKVLGRITSKDIKIDDSLKWTHLK